MNTPLRKVTMAEYLEAPERYELRSGKDRGAPTCPYGNQYEWVGYDNTKQEYLRFTKSVFKLLIQNSAPDAPRSKEE
jgi:hypothetical protein